MSESMEPEASAPMRLASLDESLRRLLDRFRAGQRAALARAISVVENQRDGFQALLHELHASAGQARLIGITGPPGAGKSTITAGLIERFRARGETVGVIAVDPTSPYTGGALLGDRIRMNEVAQDDGVFIRSMATRGALGGLAAATREVMDVVVAFGFDVVLVETVGVGQSELDIAAAADSTVVVLVPESGDSIQTMKAGLMEAADLFVVNKADRPGAQRLAREVELMLHLRLGDTMRNVPAHHGVDLRRVSAKGSTSTSTSTSGGGRGDEAAQGERSEPQSRPPAHEVSATSPPPGEPVLRSPKSMSKSKPKSMSMSMSSAGQGEREGWTIPVLLTTAETGEGVDALVGRLDGHRAWLESSGELGRRRRARLEERVRDAVKQRLLVRTWREGPGGKILADSLDALERGETTPYEVAARIVRATVG